MMQIYNAHMRHGDSSRTQVAQTKTCDLNGVTRTRVELSVS